MRNAYLTGNSCSGTREGAFIGTPVGNIGSLETVRECGAIEAAIRHQIAHGPYASEAIYGDGKAGMRIADVLAAKSVEIEERIVY